MKPQNSNELCRLLRERLELLPMVKFPFNLEMLPENGIYLFYEKGEIWGHGGNKPRIVRVGTHTGDGNFKARIKEHFLMNEGLMNFDSMKPAPKDRSIFRENIGRSLLSKEQPEYRSVWEIDFTTKSNQEKYSNPRRIEFEKRIENQITSLLRTTFAFRFIMIRGKRTRLALEKELIGTVAHCALCAPC